MSAMRISPELGAALDEALKVCAGSGSFFRGVDNPNEQSKWRGWLARWAIESFCQAVVRDGYCPMPPAVDLRRETAEETWARVAVIEASRNAESAKETTPSAGKGAKAV